MWYSTLLHLCSSLGLLVCLYALYVEQAMAVSASRGEAYEAACDFRLESGFEASCSSVLGSEYSHALSHLGLVRTGGPLDVSNSLLGLPFYLCVLGHAYLAPLIGGARRAQAALLAASTLSLLFSVYLAYILVTVLADVCVVCISIYVCNAGIFVGAIAQWLSEPEGGKAGRVAKQRKVA